LLILRISGNKMLKDKISWYT